MIGNITFPDGAVAFLDDDGNWQCESQKHSGTLSMLRQVFDPGKYGPSAGQFGVAAVIKAAKATDAKHEITAEPEPEDDEEVVY